MKIHGEFLRKIKKWREDAQKARLDNTGSWVAKECEHVFSKKILLPGEMRKCLICGLTQTSALDMEKL